MTACLATSISTYDELLSELALHVTWPLPYVYFLTHITFPVFISYNALPAFRLELRQPAHLAFPPITTSSFFSTYP